MVSHFVRWKRDHPGLPVPLAMFATVAGALLWAWTSLGAGSEIVFLILPNAFGWTATIDAGLARLLFSWTLHAIVYFWLIPAYIAFYVLLPQAAGGRLYSDKMGRIAFLLLLVFSMPIGFHHLFADPQIGAGFKFIHTVFTGMVAVPTLLTIFTICASLEIAGRLRGGRGLFGWIAALPWDRPFVLASAFSLVMLGLGGASGLINMSYALNSTVHNTQWVTGHFHLIYGGSIVIMYFAIAYELWPRLTGRPLVAPKVVRLQLWTWFIGMLVTTLPWHLVGLMGQPRRMAYFDYTDPALAPQAIWVSVSAVGGFVLVFSALLLDWRSDRLASRARGRRLAAHVLARRRSAAQPAALAQRLPRVGAACGGVDRRELRLSGGAVAAAQEHRRCRVSGPGAMKRRSAIRSLDRRHRRAVPRRGDRRLRLASFEPTRCVRRIYGPRSAERSACRSASTQASVRGEGQPASDVAWTTATRGAARARRRRPRRRARHDLQQLPRCERCQQRRGRSRTWPAKASPRSTSNSKTTRAASATRP